MHRTCFHKYSNMAIKCFKCSQDWLLLGAKSPKLTFALEGAPDVLATMLFFLLQAMP